MNGKQRNRSSARRIALSGVLLALTLITLFFATSLPINEMSLYALSSFFVAIVVIEFGIKAGWAFYIASCLLSLVIPNKLAIIPYVIFFGLYGIIKYYIEKLNKIYIEYILKLIFFNIFVVAAISFFREFIPDGLGKLPPWIMIIGLEVVFIIYDYTYTLFIQYYRQRLRSMVKF